MLPFVTIVTDWYNLYISSNNSEKYNSFKLTKAINKNYFSFIKISHHGIRIDHEPVSIIKKKRQHQLET
jgi:5'(3')-deoxyribonucleotidase